MKEEPSICLTIPALIRSDIRIAALLLELAACSAYSFYAWISWIRASYVRISFSFASSIYLSSSICCLVLLLLLYVLSISAPIPWWTKIIQRTWYIYIFKQLTADLWWCCKSSSNLRIHLDHHVLLRFNWFVSHFHLCSYPIWKDFF